MNRLVWCQILMASACATPPVDAPSAGSSVESEADPARAACEQAVDPTAECVDILTRPKIESRQEVEAAEAAREADAFRGRLAGLRAAVERRQRPVVHTTTAAVARLLDRSPAAVRRQKLERRGTRTGVADEAPTLIDPPELESDPRVSKPPTPKPAAQISAPPADKPASKAPAAATATDFNPTPEMYLRAGHCLLKGDHAGGLTALRSYRRDSSADTALAGEWALILTDATALLARISQEMEHRRLAKPSPVCMSSQVRPMVGLLRVLVGPAPKSAGRVAGYGRGLVRLGRELEVRAGLPRVE